MARTCHWYAVMMQLQHKCHENVIRVLAIPTSINRNDIGAKALSRAGLMFMTGMVDEDTCEIGEDELHRAQKVA